jgi:predicted HTH transcriptional regulator
MTENQNVEWKEHWQDEYIKWYDFSGFLLEFNVSNHNQSVKTSEKTSEKILEAINSNNQITISELAEITGVTTRSIERNIQNLQQEGKLVRIGPDKGGHWKIKEDKL